MRILIPLSFSLALIACTKQNQLPTASFTLAPTTGAAPLLVNVNATSSTDPDGTITSYSWDWGDNSANGSEPATTHTYTSANTFTITLTVTDNKGGTATTSKQVTVTPTPDTTKPTIVSVTPANGADGVRKDSNIVITFSEKMDQAATQLAFQSADFPGGVTFSWNAAGTVLTINPNNDLTYNTGTTLATLAKIYAYKITTTAKDLAGNQLAVDNNFSFTTLREITYTLGSTAALDGYVYADGTLANAVGAVTYVGDSPSNVQVMSFFSFDISTLPAGLTQLTAATLRLFQNDTYHDSTLSGDPYPDLNGIITVQHLIYGSTLDTTDTNIIPLSSAAFSSTATVNYKQGNVLTNLQDDYNNRANPARSNRSQYRLAFLKPTDTDGKYDYALFNTAEAATNKPELVVEFLIP